MSTFKGTNATDFGDLLGSYYANTGTAGSPS